MASRGDIKLHEVQPIFNSNWESMPFDTSLGLIGSYTKVKSDRKSVV